MTVIKHDFGLKKRKTVRRFRALLKLDALHESNVKANPLPYLERASERIFQLEKALFEAAQALKPQFGTPPSNETVAVDKAEYERLLKCGAIVEESIAQLVSQEDEQNKT
jgi:hypothetical protein